MSNPFFSTSYRCPSCGITQSHLDNDKDTIVCDYCVHTFVKADNLNIASSKTLGQQKYVKRKLMDSIGRKVNQ